MERSERQLHLGFHAGGEDDTAVRAGRRDVLEQRRLADAGFAAQDQRPTPVGPHVCEQGFQRGALGAATDQP
jgi:hypothetical protein